MTAMSLGNNQDIEQKEKLPKKILQQWLQEVVLQYISLDNRKKQENKETLWRRSEARIARCRSQKIGVARGIAPLEDKKCRAGNKKRAGRGRITR